MSAALNASFDAGSRDEANGDQDLSTTLQSKDIITSPEGGFFLSGANVWSVFTSKLYLRSVKIDPIVTHSLNQGASRYDYGKTRSFGRKSRHFVSAYYLSRSC